MAKSGVLTGVVAVVLGVVIGIVGLLAFSSVLNPSPEKAASQVNQKDEQAPPPVYGHK
jgi:hypothetical protein